MDVVKIHPHENNHSSPAIRIRDRICTQVLCSPYVINSLIGQRVVMILDVGPFLFTLPDKNLGKAEYGNIFSSTGELLSVALVKCESKCVSKQLLQITFKVSKVFSVLNNLKQR